MTPATVLKTISRDSCDRVSNREAPNAPTPPSQMPDGVDGYLEHETGLEPAFPSRLDRLQHVQALILAVS